MKKKHLGIHINPDMHYKVRYIAIHRNRSLSKQIMHALQALINSYEAEYGEIELPPDVVEEMITEEDR